MEDLYSFLEQEEPGRWQMLYYGEGKTFILNGGSKVRGIREASALSNKKLISTTVNLVRVADQAQLAGQGQEQLLLQ